MQQNGTADPLFKLTFVLISFILIAEIKYFNVQTLEGDKRHRSSKIICAAGEIRRKGKGDHINIKMPKGQIITIPGSKELKVGLLKAAIKKSGLTEEEFLELM